MATMILDNIGSGNGLLPDGTKPLPDIVDLSSEGFCGIYEFEKDILKIIFKSPRGQ